MTMDVPISKTGLLIVVSGPAGSGKTTLCNHMLMKEPTLSRVVTSTTRKPRKGEKDQIDYHFFDHATFEEKIKDDPVGRYWVIHFDHMECGLNRSWLFISTRSATRLFHRLVMPAEE